MLLTKKDKPVWIDVTTIWQNALGYEVQKHAGADVYRHRIRISGEGKTAWMSGKPNIVPGFGKR